MKMEEQFYSLGLKTLKIPLRLFEENRQRLCERLKRLLGEKASSTIVVLQGGDDVPKDATDTQHVFRQESFFHWAFGVREPGVYGSINVGTGKSSLFMPRLPESFAVWMGHIETPKQFKEKYLVNEVFYTEDIESILKKDNPELLLTLAGVNADSGRSYKELSFDGMEKFNIDKALLYPEITEWRPKMIRPTCELVRPLLRPYHRVQMMSCARVGTDAIARIGRSTILVQEGTAIQELPLVFRKTNNFMTLMENRGEIYEPLHEVTSSEPTMSDEAMTAKIRQCQSYKSIFELLSKTRFEKVTSHVAIRVLAAIADLGMNFEYRNQRQYIQGAQPPSDSFVESAILKQLFDTILLDSNSSILVEAIKLVSRPSFPVDIESYRLRLCSEALSRANDCVLSLEQLAELAKYLSGMESAADMLWRCLSERRNEITPCNVIKLYAILPYLKTSRNMVLQIIEGRSIEHLSDMNANQIVQILSSYATTRLSSRTICNKFTSWLKMNLHKVDEEVMNSVLNNFVLLNFSSEDLEQVLEKFLKMCPVTDESFFVTYLTWCRQHRIRNTVILEKSVEYFLANGQNMSVGGLEAMLCCFGTVNYDPHQRNFWSLFEEVLGKKFIQCPPNVVTSVLMSCVHLQRFPLNFMSRVFSPFFLDRLHHVQGQKHSVALEILRNLDASLTIECPGYNGPKLAKTEGYQKFDGRVVKMTNILKFYFDKLCHGTVGITNMLPVTDFPGFYRVDVLLHEKGTEARKKHGFRKDNNNTTAVLIHVPEQYTSSGELVGAQAMRVRQLELMGFQVISLKYDDMLRLRNRPILFKRYLRSNLLFKSCIKQYITKPEESDDFW